MRSIGETASLLGVSVRTLRHWESCGLIAPTQVSQAGYRFYDDTALARLQLVLFYRDLGIALSHIARMLDAPGFDLNATLREHRDLLLLKRQRLDEMIDMVEATIERKSMKPIKTTMKDIQDAKKRYAKEAQERWGHTEAWKQSTAVERTQVQELEAAQGADAIFSAFAELAGTDPAEPKVQALVQRWQEHISAHHYPCSKEILAGLGEMYTGDERFTQNLDRFGPGTAQLMSDAIRIYCTT